MATVNALSVALFNAAAGGYAAEMTANAAGFANAVGPILEKDVSTDALFVDHLLSNLGVTSTNAVYAQAKAAVAALVTTKGRAGAAVDAIDFLKAQEGSTSAYATIAADFAAKVNTAATFTAANATERDITKLVSGVTGVDTDAAALAAATAAAEAAAATAAAAAATKAAADLAAANAAAEAAATAAAAALAAAEAEAAAELAAANAAAEAAATAAAAALAAAEAEAAAELAAANATIASLNAPVGRTTALSTSADTVLGVSGGNDSITGTDATSDDSDLIVDVSTTDNDTLTISARSFQNSVSTASDTIINIENVNVVYDTLTNASLNLAGMITGGTVATSNVRSGSGASLTVTNVADNTTLNVSNFNTATATADAAGDLVINANAATGTITATVSTTGTLAVNAAAAATISTTAATGATTVNAAAATSITSSSTSGAITITGDAASTVSATSTSAGNIVVTTALSDNVTASTTGAGTVTVDAEGDTTLSVTARTSNITLRSADAVNNATITATGTGAGLDTDTLVVTSGDSLTIANQAADVVETISVTGTAAIDATITTSAATTYTGNSSVNFAGASTMFSGKTVNGGASVELTTLTAASADLSKATGGIEVSVTAVDTAGADAILLVNNNATVTLSADQSGGLEINADNDVTNTATVYLQGTLNLVIAENQSGIIVIDPSAASTDGFDTVNVTATKAVTGLDLRTASTTTITLAGSKTVTVDNTATGKSLNASAMTAALTAEATANLKSVTGGSGNDVLTSDATGATIVVNAGAGNDTVDVGGAVTGTFSGGDGTDTLDITGAVNISAATISGFETIDVNANAVTLATDMLSGQSLVVDGTGSITLNDIGATVDLGSLSFASTLTATGVSVDFSGANRSSDLGAGAAFTYTGSSQIDTVTGGSGDDTIFGGDGADTIVGNAGDNYLDGGAGNDSITSTTGDDTIFGQANNDTISSGAGDDTVDGGTGDDTIDGEAGDDSLVGGTGVDTITGGDGADSVDLTETTSSIDTVVIAAVVGTSGDSDRVTATGNNNDTGEDTITGFKWGTDVIKISATAVASFVHGTDTTIGTATGDVNDGTAGSFLTTVGLVELNQTTNNDWDDLGDIALTFASPSASVSEARFEAALQYTVAGTAGADTITTGDNADTITGGVGADTLTGGSGADTYVMVVADVGDTITDFATADKIDWNTALSSTDASTTVPTYQAAAAATAIGATTTVFELTGVTGLTGAAALVTALGATATNTDTNANILFVYYITGGGAEIYNWINTDADVEASELTLVATLTGVAADSIVTGNFI